MKKSSAMQGLATLAAVGVGFTAMMLVHPAGQNDRQAPSFEVASIKPSSGRPVYKVESDPGRLTMEGTQLDTMIRLAYGLQEYQLQAPAWTHTARFDVTGVTASPSTRAAELTMLQTLLEQRMGLESPHEAKTMPVYLLEVAPGGPKLTPAAPAADGHEPFDLYYHIGIEPAPGGTTQLHTLTGMALFADFLTRIAERPVLDRTALQGRYNILLQCAISGYPGEDTSPTIFQALPRQLGLTLVAADAPVQITIIDHLLEKPTGN